VSGVPGRMELIEAGQPFSVVVDSPHARGPGPVLGVLRDACGGRLWAVFGCAGERDTGRRDGMGRVAGRLADSVVLTNEDPRSEDPDTVIEDIAVGLREAGRSEGATSCAFQTGGRPSPTSSRAGAGDIVLLAGKGASRPWSSATSTCLGTSGWWPASCWRR
jgi:UDP-N-acetylmuramoyl-L-alanyl-D-glutamate--2,6-diaminopimelate ligase